MKTALRRLGVFDSGVGGLTVVKAIHQLMPSQPIVYLGDTARVPYGNKSAETILRFAREDCAFLLSRKVSAIVIACNTASAHALEQLRLELPVPVFGVIDPGVNAALSHTRTGRIGIMGTAGTIASEAYQNALKRERPDLFIFAQATPLLVPLVEEDWLFHEATKLVLKDYLAPFQEAGVDTLVLACTHYPLLKESIRQIMGPQVALVDSATTCAQGLKVFLEESGENFSGQTERGDIDIFLTDHPRGFASLAARFLGEELEPSEVVSLPSLPA